MEKFKPGMTFREVLTVANLNEIVDTVNLSKENQNQLPRSSKSGQGYNLGEIRIIHNESSAFEQFAAVSLTGLELTAQNCDSFAFEIPTFTAGKVTAARKDMPFAICLEPANSGELSKALVTGVTPAKVTIKDASHQYAKPTTDSSTGALESCDAGTARILFKAGSSGEQWCILQLGAGGAGGGEYNGYFKIVNASTSSSGTVTNRIKIVDGATYNSTSGTSGKSVCKVNNAVFQIDPFSADVSGTKTYVLKYTAGTAASGSTPATAATVEIVALDSMPSDTKKNAYYQIGRAIITNGQMKIQQDHTAGVAQIYWYLLCSEDEE